MKPRCSELQDRMAKIGASAFQDEAQAMELVASCEDCSAVLRELEDLDALLDDLPFVDAPDAVVEALMRRPELQESPKHGFLTRIQQRFHGWRSWGLGGRTVWQPLGTAAALLLVTTVSWQLFTGGGNGTDQVQMVTFDAAATEPQAFSRDLMATEGEAKDEAEDASSLIAVDLDLETREVDVRQDANERKQEKARISSELRALGYIGGEPEEPAEESTSASARSNTSQTPTAKPRPPMQPEPTPGWRQEEAQDGVQEVYEEITVVGEAMARVSTSAVKLTKKPAALDDEAEMDAVFGLPDAAPVDGGGQLRDADRKGFQYTSKKAQDQPTVGQDQIDLGALQGVVGVSSETPASPAPQEPGVPSRRAEKEVGGGVDLPSDPLAAQGFLELRDRTEGVTFQSADGYWRNTYVPGDPELRYLAARLGSASEPGVDSPPHSLARTPRQPFDVPDNAALAVYLSADRRAVDGRQRMLVQVGLQGTERHGGRRGAMRVTVVLDLNPDFIDDDALQRMNALLTALAKAKEPGDQFRLVVAGRGGGEVVGVEDFRHGPLSLALQEAAETARDASLPRLSSADAHRQAVLTASGAMDPDAPLGSSLVLLVTPSWISESSRHERIARRGALEGVHTSVVAVGSDLDLEELDRIVLAGQGHRRLLHQPSDAESLVDHELQSVSRVIARAVRLRIRLSPGVHLVDVLGSERLSSTAAQHVRDAEAQVDRRLSRQLGIAADRGEDEEGLQIVIPSFYAGDSHVVLLDVVTDGAGPIADVRVRYKDLVHLENGVARARLDVPRGRDLAPGPLQRNVLQNLMALELRGVLMEAADLVATEQEAQAADVLRRFEALLRGLEAHVPGWSGDGDVERDLRLLSHSRRLLSAADDEQRDALEDSLRYSGYLKTLPAPVENAFDSEPPPQ